MTWTNSADIKAQISRWWDKGDLLVEPYQEDPTFPRRLKFKSPTSSEMSTHFEDVRLWIAQVSEIKGIRLKHQEVSHRIIGKNSVPREAWIESCGDALLLIGKKQAAEKFYQLWQSTTTEHSELIPWLKRRPLQALALYDQWPQILRVVSWMKQNHRPGIYLRQVDVIGVHSKFIENNRSVLLELLDLALPVDALDLTYSGAKKFSQRYGFREKPLLVRFRILDQELSIFGGAQEDVTLDANTFARLKLNLSRVFIVENEINFLAFPAMPRSMVVFGAGYGLDYLSRISWMQNLDVLYWGDIDTHGFAILNSARTYLPHLRSILMDQGTLLAHQYVWGVERDQHGAGNLEALSEPDYEMYQALKNGRWGQNIRLEQEHIDWKYAEGILRLVY